MAFTKDDKDYLGLVLKAEVKPLKEGIDRLNTQMEAHDDETSKINNVQQQMIGSWNTIKYMVLPIGIGVAVSLITWYFTKS